MPQSNISRVVTDTFDIKAQATATGTRIKNLGTAVYLKAIAAVAGVMTETGWQALFAKSVALQGANATNNVVLTVPTVGTSYTITMPANAPSVSIPAGVSALAINATGAAAWLSLSPAICQGRLTGVTAAPTADTTLAGSTTLYFTPYLGNLIGLFDGTNWTISVFTEQSISVTGLTSGSVYDVFIDNTSTLSTQVWTSTTARTGFSLVLQDGVYVLTGTTSKRYLGTICPQQPGANVVVMDYGGANNKTPQRLISNMYNRIPRALYYEDNTASWNYSVATYRQARANTAARVDVLAGMAPTLNATLFDAQYQIVASSLALAGIAIAMGEDSTTTPYTASSSVTSSNYQGLLYRLVKNVPLGLHSYNLLELGNAGTTVTWYGGDSTTVGVVGG